MQKEDGKEVYGDEEIVQLVEEYISRSSPQIDNNPNDIVFQNFSVTGAGLGHQKVSDVPTALRRWWDFISLTKWLPRKPTPSRTLLYPMTGTIRQGEMLAVVGRPGSGCTTFLKSMANMREEYLAMDGQVWYGQYDSQTVKDTRPEHTAFVGEDDIHFPSLSVNTTLRFALNARRPVGEANRSANLQKDLETILQLMGLSQAAPVRVGSDRIRGVSGGQRRRVSLAEAFATRAGLFCFDSPTRGLDSSTAMRFIKVCRHYTVRARCATIISIYQASDEALRQFDKVIILNEGHVAYHGPVSEAKSYFESLGFYCSPRTTLSDFLTSMSGGPELREVKDGIERPAPLRPADFEARFHESYFYRQALEEAKAKVPKPLASKPKPSQYALPFYRQIYACTFRHYQIHLSDRATWVAEAAGTIVQALLLGTLFRNQSDFTQGLYTRCSALFFCVLIMGLQASAEFGNTFSQRPILLKQKSLRFYRPGAYALGQILADVPWKFIFVLYSLPIYWMVNFRRTPGGFFTWLVSLYAGLMALAVSFRTIAVFTTSPTRAILPVGLLLNLLIIYTGFYVNPPGMKVWLSWIRYLNPMYYSFESIALNELAPSTYHCSTQDIVPKGPSYNNELYQTCALSGSSAGNLTLAGRLYLLVEYGFKNSHKWRNVGINAGFFVFFSILVAIGMEQFRIPADRMSTIFYRKLPEAVNNSASSRTDSKRSNHDDSDMATDIEVPNKELHLRRADSTKYLFGWSNLSLDLNGGPKRLLNDVSGWLPPGSMTALMGVSGAGKTTLLDTLAQRIDIGVVSGKLFLDGKALPASARRRTGFVHQNDIHLSSSTVREALQFSAYLHRSTAVLTEEKNADVEAVIDALDMREFADAVIGVPGNGLNLEQRKRVSIGVELAAKPDILLFLDEPTSGLNGTSALSIVQLLRKLSNAGQTILCTIHQPSAEIIHQFDSLLLLVPGGKTAYFGPLGHQFQTILNYFSRYTRACREDENPADYLIDISTDPNIDWFKVWEESPEYASAQEYLASVLEAGDQQVTKKPDTDQTFATSYIWQLGVVTRRAFIDYWRDSDYVLGKVQLAIWMGLMNGLTFLQLSNDLTDARGRMFSIFVGVITGPVLSLQIEPRFVQLRDQFLSRERESKVYHWGVFVISAQVVEIPFTLLGGLIYWLLWYYMVGYFTTSSRAGYAFVMYELYSLFVASIAQLTAAIFPTVQAAQVATGFVWLVINTFNGPLSPPPLTPRGWRWFYNISPLFYFIEGIGTNAMSQLAISCRASEISVFHAPDLETCGSYAATFLNSSSTTGYLLNPNDRGTCQYCAYTDGDKYLNQYDFSFTNRGRNVGIFIGFILFNYTMTALATYVIFVFKWKRR